MDSEQPKYDGPGPNFWGCTASFPKSKYRVVETEDGWDLWVWDDGSYR